MDVQRLTMTEKVSTKVTAVVVQVIDAVSAVLRYRTSLFKDDNCTFFTPWSVIVPVSCTRYSDVILNPAPKLRTTDLFGYTVVPSHQPNLRSTLRINSLRMNLIRNALIPYSSADTAPLSFLLIATPLLSTGYVS